MIVLVTVITYNGSVSHGAIIQPPNTSKSITVTCNGRSGQITTNNASLAKNTAVSWEVLNTFIHHNTDIAVINIASGATPNCYTVGISRINAVTHSFTVTLLNHSTTGLSDTLVLNFVVLNVS